MGLGFRVKGHGVCRGGGRRGRLRISKCGDAWYAVCSMKPKPGLFESVTPAEKAAEQEGVPELGYATWERAKIERGLAQSRDRTAMISVEQVWRDLKLEV
jgi:hypothetical protein